MNIHYEEEESSENEDFYSEDSVQHFLDDDAISASEEAFMVGYLEG